MKCRECGNGIGATGIGLNHEIFCSIRCRDKYKARLGLSESDIAKGRGNSVREPLVLNWVDRLVVEQKELEDKLQKLSDYINTAPYHKLKYVDKALLTLQRDYMADYLGVLKVRIGRSK